MFVILLEFTFDYLFKIKFFGDNILDVKSIKNMIKTFTWEAQYLIGFLAYLFLAKYANTYKLIL